MHYQRRKGWEIPASSATPEALFLDRRSVLAGLGASGVFAAWAGPARAEDADPSAALYPAKRNDDYKIDRDVTPEKYNLSYNNFYEFSTSKRIDAGALKTRPWTVKLDGMVEKEQTVDIDALIKTMGLEERLYRHRCVEAWSMAIPWTGFSLRKLVDFARPLSTAKYVQFETFLDKKMAPGQRSFMPWPYVEGLTMAEAANDLAFIATGAYGKPLAKVQGAPIRLATPWKYGFKSIKSIVRVSFVDKRPQTFWETLGPDEYGFASGPTSIRTCPIPAGARRAKTSSTIIPNVRRCCSTAMASRSPRSIRGSIKSRSICEVCQPGSPRRAEPVSRERQGAISRSGCQLFSLLQARR
jgi:sulfoxide reductase catalytic subunit YedY